MAEAKEKKPGKDINKKIICAKCGSSNILIQAVAEQKKRGMMAVLGWLLLTICTLGAVIWIPLLSRKGSKTKTFATCQNCGHRWEM